MGKNFEVAVSIVARASSALAAFGSVKQSVAAMGSAVSQLKAKQNELGGAIQRHMGTLAPRTLAALNQQYIGIGRTIDQLQAKQARLTASLDWHIAMRPGKRAALDLRNALAAKIERVEKIKASIRAKVEHPFRIIKQQFGYAKVRYRGLAKNTARLQVMFALEICGWCARRFCRGRRHECACCAPKGARRGAKRPEFGQAGADIARICHITKSGSPGRCP